MSGQPPNPGSLGSPPRPGSPLVVDNRHPGVTNPSPTEAITPVPAGKPCKYPPYPPYSPEPQLVSLMDTITGGKTIRYQYKSSPPQPRSPPKPAQPKGPKVTDVRMSRREYRAHARCIKRNSPVLTERLEKISRPTRRQIIYMWRDRADVLPAETIARFRTMLDADEPIKPDQAYQHFRNVKKSRKKKKPSQVLKAKKKKKMDIYGDKKCEWARNATITLARSLQQRLSRPGSYNLQDGMLNLSNVVMCEIAKYLHMKPVHRQCPCPKAKFLMELSDKIAVWIDEVMLESDERMLMMDADEDDEVIAMYAAGGGGYGGFGGPGGDQFADEFLDMMGGKRKSKYETDSQPAHLKFTGEMKNAFHILTKAMDAKGNETLLEYGKHKETYRSGADELRRTTDFTVKELNMNLSKEVKQKLKEITDGKTPEQTKPHMKAMIDICGDYLAQHAEYSKDKGPAFKILVQKMKGKGSAPLYTRNNIFKPYNVAAKDLEDAKGLDTDGDDQELTKKIQSELEKTVAQHTPSNMKDEMKDAIDKSSKYLSYKAIHDEQRGEPFEMLIKLLQQKGDKKFSPQHKELETNHLAAHALKTAPRLDVTNPDPALAAQFKKALEEVALKDTPPEMLEQMREVIQMCSNYLSVYVRDRGKAMQNLLQHMKGKGNEELVRRLNYGMTYAKAAQEVEEAPGIVPYLPVKDIADEVQVKLTDGMKNKTPKGLEHATKALINDVAGHLSQPVALRSGSAGERYPLNYLANVKESLGDRKLYDYKNYTQTYKGAARELKAAGELTSTSQELNFAHAINEEMKEGVRTRVGPGIHFDLTGTMAAASQHLANIGSARGEALEHLVSEMDKKGNQKLARLQGYDQTYKEAASRVKRTDTLETSRVDQPAYKDVGSKLNALMRDKPPPQKLATAMPEVVDETAQFLASPIPETKGEKRKVLADLMGRKQDDVLGKDGHYKMTYDEGGKKFIDAPYDINPVSLDPEKQKEVTRGVKSVVPHDNQPLQHVLSETTREAGSHLTDVMKGRKEAMDVIHTGLKEGADKDLINTGPHRVSYADGAKMVEEAPHFQKGGAAPAISDEVEKKIGALPQSGATQLATKHMASTTKIASQYIAGGATEQSGMPVKELALPVHDDSKIAAGKAAAEGSVSAVAGTLGNPLAGGPGTSMTASPGSVTGVTGSSLAAGTKSAVAEKSGNPLTGGQGSALAGGPDSSFAQKPGIPLAGGPGSALAVGPATSPSAGPGSPSAGVPASGLGSDIGGGVEGVPSAPGSGIGGAPGSALGGQASPGVSSDGPAVPVASKGGVGSLTGGVSGPDGFPGKSGSGKIGGSASGVGVTDKDVGPDGKKKSEERGAIEGGGVAKDEGGSGGKGGGKSKSGDGEAPGHRGGHVGKSPGSRGSEKLGKDDAKGEKAKRGVDKVDVKGAKSESAEGNETSVSSEEEPLDPNACPCAVAAARIKRRHMRRQQRQETLQQNKANTLALLRKELAAKGDAPFYESIPSKLTHKQASEWLGASMRVEPSVKTSNDVTRLQAKIEDKLFELMNTKYPDPMEDAMQDVIIESARKLAENYVSKHYQKSATHAFISEMQKKGNTLLTDDGETYFYAAQRLKRSDDLYELEPCEQTSPYLQQELDNTIHGRSIPRKMVGTMKGHSKTIADYLSTRVGKPDNEITAYCTLLDEMEAQGDQDLVNNKMKLSYKEGTDYLRQLVTNEDIINKPDRDVSVQINQNLTALVNSSDALKECDRDEVKKVQTRSTNLLTSYVSSHVDKTEALKSIVEAMEQQGDAVLLRHGPVVRTFKDGAERLKYKNSSDIHNYISKSGPPDPVVLRKINVRIENIGNEALTKKPEVTKDVTTYLAKSFTEPHVSRVCKCRKSVPVQCELWCDEILRRVAKPCCVCARCGPGAAPHVACVPGAGPRAACVLCEPPCAAARPTDQCSTYALHSIHYTHSPTDRLSRALLQPPSCESWLRAADCSSSLLLGQENSTLPSTALSASTSSFDEIVSTNEMSDWNAMLVSLMWNMQAWRHWIHEQMNRAQTHNLEDSDNLPSWTDYEKRVAMEALQWRQYNIFSKQLAMKLAYRYSNKQIISPTRETNKTKEYLACQSEMIDLIAMFKKWTHWLALVLNETRDLEVPAATTTNTLNKLRWNHFYYKLQERAEDWRKYDMYFEECWKENTLNKIPGWVSGMRRGAAWVMSACGAVPCGAVPCGAVPRGGGAAWLARTTHRCQVLPAALLPSKHCCIVYADEKVFRYNKYQVLCNADVDWMPWNSGSMSSSAVPIGTKSYAGRVVYKGSHLLGPVLPPHYRCHVVLMGRPFAFNSYQLLVFNDTNKLNWTKRCS